ncbi:SDR family NAD(P)-dependent oxidoreductase [Candidatus Sumerlaeota bacterium]|nr:SDR family NAD(P)-dependent oxidoreductase [Candidatus Sumerlaeota bacterium]
MRILVTGVAGFIGSHLAERLADMGHHVVGLDCFTDYYDRALKEINAEDVRSKGVEILELDLAQDDLSAAVDGMDIVFHLAAQPGISATTPFEAYVRNNLTATYRLLEAVRPSKSLRGFINVSTSSVYGAHATDPEDVPPKPTSYYGVTKLAAEQLVLSYERQLGLPACSLRLFSVYGERERPEKLYRKLIASIVDDAEFPLYEGSLEHSRSFTYVSDIIDGLVAVLDRLDVCRGEIFNIGTDIEITTGEGIRLVEKIMNKKARLVATPRRPGDQLKTHANIDKARRILGYDPQVAPEQGLRAQVEWYCTKVHGRV